MLSSGNNKLISMNSTRQISPHSNKAIEIPSAWARLPEIRLPKGTIPLVVIMNKLITLPRKTSGTVDWSRELIIAVAGTLIPPRITSEITAQR